jgi:hypothetical protein
MPEKVLRIIPAGPRIFWECGRWECVRWVSAIFPQAWARKGTAGAEFGRLGRRKAQSIENSRHFREKDLSNR